MTTKIILKKSSVSSNAPGTGDLDYGELAINFATEDYTSRIRLM